MKFRTTVILALVAAALAIYLVLSERPAREVRQKEEEMVFSLRGEDVVQKVKLRTSHGVVVLEKLKSDPVTKEARWGLVEPVKARADNPTMSAIVSKLEFLRKVRTLAGEEAERLAPSDTGLDSTALEVTLWDKTGKEEALSVGKENPLGKNLFARVSGKKEIYLVDLSLRETLDKGLDALRSKQIVELVPFKVNSAVIETQGKEAMRLVKKDSIWEFTKPVEVRADAEKVDRLLNDLKELKVLEFLPERPDDAAAFGLDKPTSTFSFEMDGESQTVLFSRRTEKVKVGEKEEEREKGYAMVQGEPTIYSIEPYQVSAFAPEFASLRDRHVVYFSTFDVTELSVKNPTAEVAFKKEEFEWKMTSPKTVPADRTAVGDLLDKPLDHGGLALSRYSASAVFMIFIICCIVILPQKTK